MSDNRGNCQKGEVALHQISLTRRVSIKMTKSKAVERVRECFILWGLALILICSFRCCRGPRIIRTHCFDYRSDPAGFLWRSSKKKKKIQLWWVKRVLGVVGALNCACAWTGGCHFKSLSLSMKIQYLWRKWSIPLLFPSQLISQHLTLDCSRGAR